MQKQKLLNIILTIIEEHEDIDSLLSMEDLKFESKLQEDLGFDSIAIMSLVYELQELYLNFDIVNMYKWNTLGDIVDELSKVS